jgi:DNA polymerase III, subunit gamma and tau
MYQVLYNKYRPYGFDDVCGQEHITSVLRYETESGNVAHAYLFCGSRGTGKTTCAKILAKAINCEDLKNGNPCGECESCRAINMGYVTDVIEMDAASNNGVDYIRDIRDEVAYTPAMMKKKVYIIDEVHMLSASAFNALLKTLEEPPEHVVFILATTELHKLPATIISRCQRFDFRRLSVPVIADRIVHIAESESVKIERDAAELIAKLAQGGMRDAISLFELCCGSRDFTVTTYVVNDILGVSGYDSVCCVADSVADKRYGDIFAEIGKIMESSKDIAVFWQDLCTFYRDMFVAKTAPDPKLYLELTEPEYAALVPVADKFSLETLLYHSRLIDEALQTMANSPQNKRMCAEMTLIRMCDEKLDASNEALMSRISALEDKLAMMMSGGIVTADIPAKKAEVKETKSAKLAADTPEPDKVSAQNTSETKQNQQPIECWDDAVERLSEVDKGLQSFLLDSEAFSTDGGKVVIKVANPFAVTIMEQDDSRQAVVNALQVCGFAIAGTSDLSIVQAAKQKKTTEFIDEIL